MKLKSRKFYQTKEGKYIYVSSVRNDNNDHQAIKWYVPDGCEIKNINDLEEVDMMDILFILNRKL